MEKNHLHHAANSNVDGASQPKFRPLSKYCSMSREVGCVATRALPPGIIARKTLKTACMKIQEVIAARVHAWSEEYLAETEIRLANREGDPAHQQGRGWHDVKGYSSNT